MILFNLSSIKQAHMGQHYQKLAEGELTEQAIVEKLCNNNCSAGYFAHLPLKHL